MTQQNHTVIVYRNPAEQQFWESGMAFPLFVALAVGFVCFLAMCSAFDRAVRSRHGNAIMTLFAVIAFAAGGFVFHQLLI